MNKIVKGKKTKWQLRRRIKKLSFILALILLLVIISPLTSKSSYAKSKKELYNLNTSDTPIGFGETITGSIDDVGKSVNYTFSASSGDAILIRMRRITATSFFPAIKLYSPFGIELSTDFDSTIAEITYLLPQNGEYLIVASDYYDSTVSNYNIYLQRINNPGNATTMAFGTNYYGSIAMLGAADTYTFIANVGDMIIIRMGKISGTYFESDLRLYSPTGTELISGSKEISYALPQNGKYILIAHDSEGDSGSYNLIAQRVNNPNNSILIELGKTISAGISFPGGVNSFTFSALAGDTVLIRMREISGTSFWPEIRLLSPSGTELSNDWDDSFAEITYLLPNNGDYTILATDYFGIESGSYGIYVQLVNRPVNATSISFGEKYFGAIGFLGGADTYTFLANSGDVILIRMNKVSGAPFGSDFKIYSPSGTELIAGSIEASYTLPQNGEYTIIAHDNNGNVGTYYIYSQRINNPNNYEYVEFGRTEFSTFGAIEHPAEADTYTFSGNSGDQVIIKINEISGTNFYPEIRLYSSSGTELSSNWGNDNAEITYTLPENGVYAVLAMEYQDIHSGSYEISFQWPLKVYDPTQNPTFSVFTFEDTRSVFGTIDLDIKLHIISPNNDMEAFKLALQSWGVNLYDFENVELCVLVEVGDFYELFDYLESMVPSVFTTEIRNYLESKISDDGYLRLLLTTMSDIVGYSWDQLKELVGYFVNEYIFNEKIEISRALFEPLENVFKLFYNIADSSSGSKIKLILKPEWGGVELLIGFLSSMTQNYNIQLHLMFVDDDIITTSNILDLRPLVEDIKKITSTLKLIYKFAIALAQGFANPVSNAKLLIKSVTYFFDYFLNYEASKEGILVNLIYFILSAVDPPTARLDIQIRDADTNELLLGYDTDTNTTIYTNENGFFSGDLESQIIFIKPTVFPVNVCVINTHLDSQKPFVYLNQSLIFGVSNHSSYQKMFSYVKSTDQLFTLMNYSPESGLIYNKITVEILEQAETWVKVKILDGNNQVIQNPQIKIFYQDLILNRTISNLGGGIYEITLDSIYSDKHIYIVVEKQGYLSNSSNVILGTWKAEEEVIAPPVEIPGYNLFIILVICLGIAVLLKRKQVIK